MAMHLKIKTNELYLSNLAIFCLYENKWEQFKVFSSRYGGLNEDRHANANE